MERGLLFASLSIILWGLVDTSGKIAMSYFAFNPFLFSCLSFTFAGFSLLALAGWGKNGMKTLTHTHTWAWGFLRVINLICLTFAYTAITATEVAFINRISVILALILSFMFIGRKPNKYHLPGLALIFLCVFGLAFRQEGGLGNIHVWIVFLAALLNAAMALLIETHPVSQQSMGIRDRCRYTGVVLLIASLVFMGCAFLANLAQGVLPEALANTIHIKNLNQLHDLNLYLFSCAMGICFIAPAMYTTFYAIRLLNTDNMMMIGTIIPFSTIILESILSFFGILDIRAFDATDMLLGLGITCGALYSLFINIKQRKQTETIKTLQK